LLLIRFSNKLLQLLFVFYTYGVIFWSQRTQQAFIARHFMSVKLWCLYFFMTAARRPTSLHFECFKANPSHPRTVLVHLEMSSGYKFSTTTHIIIIILRGRR
jgi:hypothetical protein